MEMRVPDGLSCSRSIVHADVERVGRELLLQLFANDARRGPDCRLLLLIQVENARRMPARNDERVSIADGKRVTKRPNVLVDQDASFITEFAKGAGRIHIKFTR
jgi:hypothetical protein